MNADQLNFSQKAVATLVPASERGGSDLNLKGKYVVQHWRDGKRIDEWHFHNDIVNEGKNQLLNAQFHAVTAITAWFLGLIDNAGYTALAATDTYDDINQAANGWDEFTAYTDAGNGDSATTRPAWPEDAASGQSITNSTVAIFDITGTGTVKGLFLVGGIANANLKDNHEPGGTLWATALFGSGDVAVQNGDQLKVTYTVSA
jgi:hypothetical protein